MPQDPWDDHNRHLQHLPDQVLFSVARNDCADRGYRRHAVEILVTRKSHYAKNPELADLVAELEIELDGIQFEHPVQRGPGPLVASVTTDTMFSSGLPEKEDDARTDDSSLRSEARPDNTEQGRVLPGQQEPAAGLDGNPASAPPRSVV